MKLAWSSKLVLPMSKSFAAFAARFTRSKAIGRMRFHKLSEIAHELEDVLSPQVGKAKGAGLAEIVLAAADTFEAMLGAYQRQVEPPPVDGLRAMILGLLSGPAEKDSRENAPQTPAEGRFAWGEYESLMIPKRFIVAKRL